jgi:hypothetical protein
MSSHALSFAVALAATAGGTVSESATCESLATFTRANTTCRVLR